jgi:hypothetical protein
LRCWTTSKTLHLALDPSVLSPHREAVPMSDNNSPGSISSEFVFRGDCALAISELGASRMARVDWPSVVDAADSEKARLRETECAVLKCGLRSGSCLGFDSAISMSACDDSSGPFGDRLVAVGSRDATLTCSRGAIDACKGLNGLFGTCAAWSKLQLECFVK